MLLLAFAADLNSALERRAVFHADAHGRDVSGDRTFSTDIDAIAALDVAIDLAHHDDFFGLDAGVDLAIAADGHAAFGHDDLAFNAAIDVEGLRSGNFALNDQSAADGRLIHGSGDGLDGVERVGVRSRRSGLQERVIRRLKHATFLGFPPGALLAPDTIPAVGLEICGLRVRGHLATLTIAHR